MERRIIRATTEARREWRHAPPTVADLARLSPAELRKLGLHARRGATLVRLCALGELERLKDAADRRRRRPARTRARPRPVVGRRRLPRGARPVRARARGRPRPREAARASCAAGGSRAGRPPSCSSRTSEWAGLASVYMLAGYAKGLLPLSRARRREAAARRPASVTRNPDFTDHRRILEHHPARRARAVDLRELGRARGRRSPRACRSSPRTPTSAPARRSPSDDPRRRPLRPRLPHRPRARRRASSSSTSGSSPTATATSSATSTACRRCSTSPRSTASRSPSRRSRARSARRSTTSAAPASATRAAASRSTPSSSPPTASSTAAHELGDLIAHVHVKDFDPAVWGTKPRRYLLPGEGVLDLDGFLERLPYDGTVTLEMSAVRDDGDDRRRPARGRRRRGSVDSAA